MKPVVCVQCRLFFKIKKNGVEIEEGMPPGDGTWAPYKLWQGEQIIQGFGQAPISEHFKPGYAKAVADLQPLFRVDDC